MFQKTTKKTNRRVSYLDYASTTPLDPRVQKVMRKVENEAWGNPSSIHRFGQKAKKILDQSRKAVARILNVGENEIVFTSGGTEANNLAIFGVVRSFEKKGISISDMHFVTTNIEHSSVLECFKELERRGASVSYVPVPKNGIVLPQAVFKALRKNTILVSVMYANNEIGTIQPIAKISRVLRFLKSHRLKHVASPIFHTDASQSPLYLDLNMSRLGAHMITLDGHKIYGPKGVGLLSVKKNIPIEPIILGGGQEGGMRSTTENLSAIAGFAEALSLAVSGREKECKRLSKLRDYSLRSLREAFPEAILNGDEKDRLPNNINISLPDIDSDYVVIALDQKGICSSTRSSCLKDAEGSYVISALGGSEDRSKNSLRFTFGRDSKKRDVDALVSELKRIVPLFRM